MGLSEGEDLVILVRSV